MDGGGGESRCGDTYAGIGGVHLEDIEGCSMGVDMSGQLRYGIDCGIYFQTTDTLPAIITGTTMVISPPFSSYHRPHRWPWLHDCNLTWASVRSYGGSGRECVRRAQVARNMLSKIGLEARTLPRR